jgi:predicted lactoylglutathione lyase
MMEKMIFVNLPVSNLAESTRFYQAIGCRKNPRFSDGNAASMVWADSITFQLLTREYFSTFTAKDVPDPHHNCLVLLALAQESRDRVDALVEAAAGAGGRADVRERMDMGWLYNRAVEDPDGHMLELVWTDMAAMPAPAAAHA